jgi:hypothetical protein
MLLEVVDEQGSLVFVLLFVAKTTYELCYPSIHPSFVRVKTDLPAQQHIDPKSGSNVGSTATIRLAAHVQTFSSRSLAGSFGRVGDS